MAEGLPACVQVSSDPGSGTKSKPSCHVVRIEICRFSIPLQALRNIVGDGAGGEITGCLGLIFLCLLPVIFSIFKYLGARSPSATRVFPLLSFLNGSIKGTDRLVHPEANG